MITRKNRLFINEYIKTNNGSEAVRRVYPKIRNAGSYANKLLAKGEIRLEIDTICKSLVLDVEAIKKAITEISRNGKVESNKLRALELLAKIEGLYKDNSVSNIHLLQGIMPQPVITHAVSTQELIRQAGS